MKKITTLLTIGAAAIGIQSAMASLIINGNFDSGNTGFSSDYSYKTPPNTSAGQYFITSNAQNWNSVFTSLAGYGGSGSLLVANGSTSTTASPWFQTISNPSVTLTTDTNNPTYYRFEAQVANVDPVSNPPYAPPNLSFEVRVDGGSWGQLTSTPNLTYLNGVWLLTYADTYITSAPSSLSFRLRNQATDFVGNDFALDRIFFGLTSAAPSFATNPMIRSAGNIANPTYVAPLEPNTVPEPGQVAASLLLLGGIGGYVFLKRRKAAKAAAPAAA